MLKGPKRIYEIRKPDLPAKVCEVCGDRIAATRRVAREWARIHYCSAVCRRTGSEQGRLAAAS
jgi:hypothetical protein